MTADVNLQNISVTFGNFYAVSNLFAYSALASANQGGSGGHGFSLEAVAPGYTA